MITEWRHTQDVALYKRDIEKLQEELKNLKEIEEEHRKLNGELRLEIAEFKRHYKVLTGKEYI